MAKAKKSVVRTTNKQAVETIKAALARLASESKLTEKVKALREQASELQGGKYQAVFEVAQRSTNKPAFDNAVASVKAAMKDSGNNIDRTYSNAVSAVRRYWALCIQHDGMVVKINKAGDTAKVNKSIKGVATFNQLKVIAEAAKKQAEQAANQGTALPTVLADKRSLLLEKLEHTTDETAAAALDAALAFFLVGGEAKHGKAHGEPVKTNDRKAAVSGAATATAKQNRAANKVQAAANA